VDADDGAKALVITGSGDTFLSGIDVGKVTSRVSEMDPAAWHDFRELTSSQYSTIREMRKPTIAAINGACVVGGLPIALSCDIRIASTEAIFRVGYRRVGLMPSASICFVLPFLIGLGRAKLFALTDKTLSAAEAKEWGLIEETTEPAVLMDAAIALAEDIASGPPQMVAFTKQVMNQAYGLDLELLRKQIDYMQFMLGKTEDHSEAIQAFAEKRQPKFKGR
jgi:2-(1,2-epoxy-1,2-dihydrophenyl)acetyl-CoA isomerase